MSTTTEQVIILIIAVIIVLLFLGILFLVTLAYSSNRRKRLQMEKQALMDEFDKQLMQSKLEMQEETFNFISQEIHDNVGQVLSLAKVQLAILDEGKEFNRDLIHQAAESVSKAMSELRDIAKSLSTDRIKSFDFVNSIDEEVYRINKTGVVQIVLHKQGKISIKDEHKLILFRVLQETFQNIIKHAKASTIYLEMVAFEQSFKIIIKDDGVGFQLEEALKISQGLGLKNMRQRIGLIGGTFLIQSIKGEGTFIEIKIDQQCSI